MFNQTSIKDQKFKRSLDFYLHIADNFKSQTIVPIRLSVCEISNFSGHQTLYTGQLQTSVKAQFYSFDTPQ